MGQKLLKTAQNHEIDLTRWNGIPFNADLTDQSSGGSRVVPGCGGNSSHPMHNFFEGKILKKVGER